MSYDSTTLNRIYDRTSGYCHICGKKLSFTNYGKFGRKGAWEVEHSTPRAKGGTGHLNNLYAACIRCNREKQVVTTQTARCWHGRTKAPLSSARREEARGSNALAGAAAAGFLGLLAGPGVAAICAVLGGVIGFQTNPDNS